MLPSPHIHTDTNTQVEISDTFPGGGEAAEDTGAQAAPTAVQHLPSLPGAPGSRGQRWPEVKGLSPAGLGRLFSAPLLLSGGRRRAPRAAPAAFPALSRVCSTKPPGQPAPLNGSEGKDRGAGKPHPAGSGDPGRYQ